MYELKYKLWLEKDGKIFGKGPYELLLGVQKYGSLVESAKHLNMSYNKAHNLIKDIEARLGFYLIIAKVGGAKGGSSELTEDAEFLMEKYRRFSEECEASIKNIFHKYFD